MPLHKEGYKIRMCAVCAGAFEYDPDEFDRTPDTHEQADDSCPIQYR